MCQGRGGNQLFRANTDRMAGNAHEGGGRGVEGIRAMRQRPSKGLE